MQARICRAKKRNNKGEDGAIEIGEILPFLEHELHRQLISKLKLRGMNALFFFRMQVGLNHNSCICVLLPRLFYQISINDDMIIGVGTGTGLCLAALPVPSAMQFLEVSLMLICIVLSDLVHLNITSIHALLILGHRRKAVHKRG